MPYCGYTVFGGDETVTIPHDRVTMRYCGHTLIELDQQQQQ